MLRSPRGRCDSPLGIENAIFAPPVDIAKISFVALRYVDKRHLDEIRGGGVEDSEGGV